MPKSRVTKEELNSSYLSELMGDDKVTGNTGEAEEADDEEVEGEDDAAQDDAEGDEGSDGSADATSDTSDGDGTDKRGKRTQQQETEGRQKGARDNDTKPSIKEAEVRQIYDALKARLQPVFRSQDAKIRELTGRLKGYEDANGIAKQYNLTAQQQVDAFKLAAAMQQDLGGTIKYLLTQAKARGINIEGLGGGAVDMNAIKEMIAKEMSPITGAFHEQKQAQERLSFARQDVEAFFGEFPDAQVHEKELGELLQRYPDLTLQSAYVRLYRWYSENGLDFSVPLSKITQGRGQQQQPQGRRKPIGVRGATDTMSGSTNRDTDELASVDDNWRSIVRDVMRKSGFDTSKL